jgi:hypothetical protein
MTIIFGSVKSIAYHPELSEAPAACSPSVTDVFERRRRLSPEYKGTGKEVEKEQGGGKAVYWLISLAALVSMLAGMLYLMECATPQTADTDQLGLAARGVPSGGEVAFGQALQALSARR